MLAVGTVPAWMEILRLNIAAPSRQKVFSYSQAFGYLGGGLLPFAIGGLLDGYVQAWRWLFPIAATIALLPLLFQRRILIPAAEDPPSADSPTSPHLLTPLFAPWQTAWRLVHDQPEFRNFQIGSMIFGCSLMIIQPILPIFFVDVLNLSYTELAVALTLCKGIGFGTSAPLWAQWIQQVNIFRLSSYIAGLSLLFPLFLMLAHWHLAFLYIGYLCYGLMQSGNELVWNMSGPHFAKNSNSSLYTSVNIISVGIRGCFVPALGSACFALMGAPLVMIGSGFLSLTAASYLFSSSLRFQPADFSAIADAPTGSYSKF
jgi:MFS family permease